MCIFLLWKVGKLKCKNKYFKILGWDPHKHHSSIPQIHEIQITQWEPQMSYLLSWQYLIALNFQNHSAQVGSFSSFRGNGWVKRITSNASPYRISTLSPCLRQWVLQVVKHQSSKYSWQRLVCANLLLFQNCGQHDSIQKWT